MRADLSRRRFLAGLGASGLLPAAASLGGCSINPATGDAVFTAFMSKQDEIAIGAQEHPNILAEFGGAYESSRLDAYVGGVAQRLWRVAEVEGFTLRVTVLNSPQVNGFALPGGGIYLTRGLVALADDEAQLASVIGHEIGHISARHIAQRYSRQVLSDWGVNVVGTVSFDLLSDTVADRARVYLGGYTREQEAEADLLGIRYLKRAGYDPTAAVRFLDKLQRFAALDGQDLDGGAGAPQYVATHPQTAARRQRLAAEALGLRTTGARLGRTEHLTAIDGMLYGSDPAQGFVRGTVFAHPAKGFRFEVPAGFHLFHSRDQVIARGPQDSFILFGAAGQPHAGPMTDYLTRGWAHKLQLTQVQALRVGGHEAASGKARVETTRGERDLQLVAIRFDAATIYRFTYLIAPAVTAQLAAALQRTTQSFRALAPGEAAAFLPRRIKVARPPAADTLDSLARRLAFDDQPVARFALLNGLDAARAQARLDPDAPLKLVVEARV
jgi:predicted Zn-dependent protease